MAEKLYRFLLFTCRTLIETDNHHHIAREVSRELDQGRGMAIQEVQLTMLLYIEVIK